MLGRSSTSAANAKVVLIKMIKVKEFVQNVKVLQWINKKVKSRSE